ncbi:hypothetical protein KGA66_03455 [Actinocrinis puniceicyclus]|uniref:ScoMcrA-like SRA domain-containing protein n=1 Tax=Actinocrinis puniceicyclus TaxID=977794 RepID=A0A8J7WJK8_9ACTN|nr:hypothetical protein [Actinocrinis puniceicyclus]MBS2962090.1 hypothetical protein [Actinocrinis puniceicyclus]
MTIEAVQGDDWHLAPGDLVRRVELHARYGGSNQNGISPCRESPNILIFTDPRSGHFHGYYDRWAEDGTFRYTGEGQHGDQEFVRGNRAIRDCIEQGRHLRLFDGAKGEVRYVGEFVLDDVEPFSYGQAPETGNGPMRQVIQFHLVRAERSEPITIPTLPVGGTYQPADESVQPAPALPGIPDPDLIGRNLSAHRRLQNDLAKALDARGRIPLSPLPEDPDFDIAWHDADGTLTVCEVKSLTDASETRQLRMGLGQILDYLDLLAARSTAVRGVLWVERKPSSLRWLELCERAGVALAWPGTEDLIIG